MRKKFGSLQPERILSDVKNATIWETKVRENILNIIKPRKNVWRFNNV